MPRSSSRRIVYAAAAANLGIAVTKFLVAAVTGSSAMLSEGIYSVVDTGNEILLLSGPPPASHSAGALSRRRRLNSTSTAGRPSARSWRSA